MKTGSLLAIAFAPLIAITIETWLSGRLARWRVIAAAMLVALGAIQKSAYILQFPYYRMTGSGAGGEAIPLDYYEALVCFRKHTPQRVIAVDPGGMTMRQVVPTLWIAERWAWLPTP